MQNDEIIIISDDQKVCEVIGSMLKNENKAYKRINQVSLNEVEQIENQSIIAYFDLCHGGIEALCSLLKNIRAKGRSASVALITTKKIGLADRRKVEAVAGEPFRALQQFDHRHENATAHLRDLLGGFIL